MGFRFISKALALLASLLFSACTVNVIRSAPKLSFEGAKGTRVQVGESLLVTPTTLKARGSPILDCKVRVPSPALPAWASLNPNTCVISGRPDAALPETVYSLIATSSAGDSETARVVLTVLALKPILSYSSSTGLAGVVGTPMSVTPSTLNSRGSSITNCRIKLGTNALPAWANLNSSTCVITGTPDAILNSTVFTIMATNSIGDSDDATVSLNVVSSSAPPPSAPILASASLTESGATNSRTYHLNYGAVTGAYSEYCILQNDTDPGHCSFISGTLPSTFTVSTLEGPNILTVFLKNTEGLISTGVSTASVSLDTTAPTITSIAVAQGPGTYGAGSLLQMTVTFSEPVWVSGVPTLSLNTTPARPAEYTIGSGTADLDFEYTVISEDYAPVLNYLSTHALLPGTSIKDGANNDATLTLPALASNGLVSKQIEIDGTPSEDFVSLWSTTVPNDEISLPLPPGFSYNFEVNWGDGSQTHVSSYNDPNARHIFATPGGYTIRISGRAEAWSFSLSGSDDADKIMNVTSFGNLGWKSLDSAFKNCSNLFHFDGGRTHKVTTMREMFAWTPHLNLMGLSTFDTSRVTTMKGMFHAATGITEINLSNFDTSQVTDMSFLFSGMTSLSVLDLNFLNTSRVTSMAGMFSSLPITTLNVSGLDTSQVVDFSEMFAGSAMTDLSLSNFNTSQATTMMGMFKSTNALQALNLAGWNTAKVTSMKRMFYDTNQLNSLTLDTFDTSSVTDMSEMFADSSVPTLNLSQFNTSKVTTMRRMFYGNRLNTIDLGSFDTGQVADMSEMFAWPNGNPSFINVSSFDTKKVQSMAWMFAGNYSIHSLNLSNFDTQNVTSMQGMFQESGLQGLDLSSFNTQNVVDMSSMFSYTGIASIIFGPGFDTGQVTNMAYMFNDTSLTSLDLSRFNTSKVTNMHRMFGSCMITDLDLSNFNTALVTDMSQMFIGCTPSSLNLSSFDTHNVTNMSYMFSSFTYHGCALDLSSFNTENVRNMNAMFAYSNLTRLDLSSFNTSQVTDMGYMFYYSSLNALDLSSFSTSSVTSMERMFSSMGNLVYLDTTSWDLTQSLTSAGVFQDSNAGLKVNCDQGGTPGTGEFFGKQCWNNVPPAQESCGPNP